jgi:hypothetical protein
VSETTAFFSKIEEDIVTAKFTKVAKNKMEWVTTLKSVAEQCAEKDQAIDKIEEARTALYELSSNVRSFFNFI